MKYKIHIYGGLGAQLSGVFVQKYFREKHEDLEAKLYLHNDPKFKYSYSEDGNELLTNKEDLLVLNDYLIPKHLRTEKYRSWEVFISYLKKILNKIRLQIICVEYVQSISQWTPSFLVKNLYISDAVIDCQLKDIKEFALSLNIGTDNMPILVSHWRLGDLYFNSKKSAGDQLGYTTFLSRLLVQNNFLSRYIYTDSPSLARKLLNATILHADQMNGLKYIGRESPAWDILILGCQARIFVGTYSKLSMWIAAIRCARGLGDATYLPAKLCTEFYRLFPTIPIGAVRSYYM